MNNKVYGFTSFHSHKLEPKFMTMQAATSSPVIVRDTFPNVESKVVTWHGCMN